MTLDQLRIFIAVAELQHVTRAAEILNLTQSAVSSAIQALETRHNVRLFDRIGRRIELTRAGKLFLAEAREVLDRSRTAEKFLDQFADLSRGALSIHASQTIGCYWLVPHLVRFKQRHPGIEIRMEIGNTAEVAEAVASGRADLGFTEGEVDYESLAERTIAEDTMVLVVGGDSRWAAVPPTSLAALFELDWVLRESGSGTRSVFEAALRRAGCDPAELKVAFEFSSNEAVRTAVENGAGATMISELLVVAQLANGALCRLDLLQTRRPFRLIRHRDRQPSPAIEAFTALLPSPAAS
jgi:DNA-binding transcriptional LysR family regulator